MNREELIGKLQMVYVGDKNALNELIGYYDGLKDVIKILQQENARLKDKNQKAFKIVDEKLTNLNLTYGVDNEFREEYDELWEILKEN